MLFTRDREFYRTMVTIAVPVALQGLLTMGVNMADNIMVASLGTNAMAGVNMANVISALFVAVVSGITSGSSVLISQYWGKKDTDRIRQVFSTVFQLAMCAAVVFALAAWFAPQIVMRAVTDHQGVIEQGAPYVRIIGISFLFQAFSISLGGMLRSVEKVAVTLVIIVLTLLTNVCFNWLLIFGNMGFPEMGVRGAAVATLISRIVEFTGMVLYVFLGQKRIALKPSALLRSERWVWADFARYSLPVAVGDTQWALVGFLKASILGHMGDAVVFSANTIAESYMSLIMVFSNSLATGACVMVGKIVGRGDMLKTREYAKTIQIMFVGVGVLLCAFVFATRFLAVSAYQSAAEEIRALAAQFIAIGAFTMIGTSYHAACFVGINRGAGDGRFVFWVDFVCGWLIVLPLSALAAFVFKFPAPVVFLCIRIDQCFKWLIALLRLRGDRWIRNVTRA